MCETSDGRFGPIWWGIWEQYVVETNVKDVLDLGTGPGLLLPLIRARLPEASITGIEVQPFMLETARENAKGCNAEILEADLGEPIPLPSESVDVITAVMVLHELLFPPCAVGEIARLLRPGGVVVVYDWVSRPLSDYAQDEELTPGVIEHFREHCLFSAEDWAFMLTRAGLQVREVIGRRGNRFGMIVAEKPFN